MPLLCWIVDPRVAFMPPNVILLIFQHRLQLIFLELNWLRCHPHPHLVGEGLGALLGFMVHL